MFLTIVFYYLFDNWVRNLAYFFGASALLCIFMWAKRLKTTEWIQLLRKDGTRFYSIPFTKETELEKIEFIERFTNYMKEDTQQDTSRNTDMPV